MAGGSILVADKWGTIRNPSHRSAGTDTGDTAHWRPDYRGPDADILPELEPLQTRARDLENNDGPAAGAPQKVIDHVVGEHFRLRYIPNWQKLGRTRDWALEVGEQVENDFHLWADDPLAFDLEQRVDFTGMCGQVVRGYFSNGGHCVVPQFHDDRPGIEYGTCFMGAEIDRLSNPDGMPDTDKLRGGVEFNDRNAPENYYLQNHHPGDDFGLELAFNLFNTWEKIPARTEWGRRMFLHCFDQTRSGQTRGKPALAATMGVLKGLQRLSQAQINREVSKALTTFFIETHFGADQVAEMFGDTDDYLKERRSHMEADYGPRAYMKRTLQEDNQIALLAPGDKIVNPRDQSAGEGLGHFITYMLRMVAANVGISYETLMSDFSRVNYAAARAATQIDWRRFLGLRKWLVLNFARPVFTLWLEEYIDRGGLDATDFYDNVAAYTQCSFTGAGRGWIDPAKETQAAKTRIALGISSQQDEAAAQGKDWREAQLQQAQAIQNARRLQIEFGLTEGETARISGMDPAAAQAALAVPVPVKSDDPDEEGEEPAEDEAAVIENTE